jgi:two-component sensor histidine kinase
MGWRENGGPAVTQPGRRGFGTRLLTQGLARELGGGASIDYQSDGVICVIIATL